MLFVRLHGHLDRSAPSPWLITLCCDLESPSQLEANSSYEDDRITESQSDLSFTANRPPTCHAGPALGAWRASDNEQGHQTLTTPRMLHHNRLASVAQRRTQRRGAS